MAETWHRNDAMNTNTHGATMLQFSVMPFEIRIFRFWFILDFHGLFTGWERRWQCAWNRKDGLIWDWLKGRKM